jgi:hypothetical protein
MNNLKIRLNSMDWYSILHTLLSHNFHINVFIVFCFAPQRLVDALSEQDLEVAARTSYAYWYASKNRIHNDFCLSPTIRNNMAMKEARRHLIGGKGDYSLALITLQSSLEYRKVSSYSI